MRKEYYIQYVAWTYLTSTVSSKDIYQNENAADSKSTSMVFQTWLQHTVFNSMNVICIHSHSCYNQEIKRLCCYEWRPPMPMSTDCSTLPYLVTKYFPIITFQLCSALLWHLKCYKLKVRTTKCYNLTQYNQVLPTADIPSHCVVCNVSPILISWTHSNINGTQVHSLQENQ